MTPGDMRLIERFACGDTSLRAEAITAHRRYYTPSTFQDNWGLHMQFMSEIDNPCPDYGLRAHYRAKLKALVAA